MSEVSKTAADRTASRLQHETTKFGNGNVPYNRNFTCAISLMLKKTAALLVIDMQNAMKATQQRRNNPEAEVNIAILLDAWRCAGNPVIHIRHISRQQGSVFYPGQVGAEFQERFYPLPEEHVVEKNVPDAFITTGLERWLHVRDIRTVVTVGVSTNHSVESTARTAGNLGFSTIVVSNATFAFEQADCAGTVRSAGDVHLMSLSNISAEYAKVCSTAEVLSQLHR